MCLGCGSELVEMSPERWSKEGLVVVAEIERWSRWLSVFFYGGGDVLWVDIDEGESRGRFLRVIQWRRRRKRNGGE